MIKTLSKSIVPEKLRKFLVDKPQLYKTSKNIQIFVIRQTHDYTLFRTEETRELNVATLPRSMNDMTPVVKVVMLASKQKAPETRMYLNLLRTPAIDNNVTLSKEQKECELKDNLCQECPRCLLFGAVSTEKGREERWNIKHRIEYSSAYSLEPYEQVYEILTFNAVDSVTQSTGQALGYTENVQPLVNFPSIITLNSVTEEELIAYLKTLMACKSYGAETRLKGDAVNHIVGLVGSHDEIITPLEFNLELSDQAEQSNFVERTIDVIKGYKEYSAFNKDVQYLDKAETEIFLSDVSELSYDKDFLERIYKQSLSISKELESYSGKKESKKKGA